MVTYHILLYQFILLRFCELCLESSNLISVYWVYFRTCLILGNPSPLMDLWKGGFVLIPTMHPILCTMCPSHKIQPRWKVDQNLMRRSILRAIFSLSYPMWLKLDQCASIEKAIYKSFMLSQAYP